jgi:hypothetical protein
MPLGLLTDSFVKVASHPFNVFFPSFGSMSTVRGTTQQRVSDKRRKQAQSGGFALPSCTVDWR